MDNLSQGTIKSDCPHCRRDSFAFKYPLEETENFLIICDAHPLVEGHVLIIPKAHYSCVGEYPEGIFSEFEAIYKKTSDFVRKNYGSVCSFEHGKIGQTVFHSHVHILPCICKIEDIIPEGLTMVNELNSLNDLKSIFLKIGQYLYFSIGDKKMVVDCAIGVPRFFRDRFTKALGTEERANWKDTHTNRELMDKFDEENKRLIRKWKK